MQSRPTHRLAPRRADLTGAIVRWAAPVGVILAGVLVLAFDGHGVSWLAGLLAGGCAGATVAARRPSRRRSRGADRAERRTDVAVGELESAGWRFLHDVRGTDTTFGHVAVGPGGVILLESLSPDGAVSMRSGEPVVERVSGAGGPRLERLRPHALADAGALRDDVARLAGRRLWVQAVVVFWSEFPAGTVADGRCVYIHGTRLAAWMARRPHQLDEAEAEAVVTAIDHVAQTAVASALPIAV